MRGEGKRCREGGVIENGCDTVFNNLHARRPERARCAVELGWETIRVVHAMSYDAEHVKRSLGVLCCFGSNGLRLERWRTAVNGGSAVEAFPRYLFHGSARTRLVVGTGGSKLPNARFYAAIYYMLQYYILHINLI